MKNLSRVIFLLMPVVAGAQSYNVLSIPDSLKKGAEVVNRFNETVLEIKSPGKATLHEHHVYTVLNEEGSEFGGYNSFYDKFTAINYITGILYDAAGKEVKRVKKKDMQDVSGTDEESLMTDTRYKRHDFYCRNYPYTVDYEEEDDIEGLLFFPDWMPMSAPSMSVEFSRYVIIAPKEYQVRYKEINCNIEPVITESGNKKTYTWIIKNLPATVHEDHAPSWSEIAPNIIFAPSDFEAEGYKGNMSTWENYGKFIYQLYKGRDVLPDDIKKKVHELTDRLTSEKEKACVLYDFLQKNTRYISIQLGIGGWQPFNADYVASKKYGDCKALSNYMVALLKEAGLKARYVEIRAGKNMSPMIPDFPSFQSNHVISCVPMGKDTLWLECTSQTESPGYMGSFTGNRKGILIDEDGGHIVNTPAYTCDDNLQQRVVNATIDAEGNLSAQVNTRFTGIQQELPHALIYHASKEIREKYLNNALNLPTYQVNKSNYEEEKGKMPAVKEFLDITSTGYANASGKRLFITPNLFNKSNAKLPLTESRKFDIVYNNPFRDTDTIYIKVPEGYTTESMPQGNNIESRFGKYTTSIKVENNTIIYYRMEESHAGRFPASVYNDLVKFQEQVYKADRAKVVLVKKE